MDKGYLIFDFRLKESQEIKHWFSDLMCGMIAFHTYKTICLFIFKYLFLKYEVREVVYVFQVQALRIWHVVCEDAVYSLKTKVKLDLIITKFSLFSTGFQSAMRHLDVLWESGSDERTFKIPWNCVHISAPYASCLQPTVLYEHGFNNMTENKII